MRARLLLPMTALTMLAAPAVASAAQAHTVAPGESLSSIAAANGLTVSRLAAANGLASGAQLTAGSTVTIPPQGGETTATGPSTSATSSAAPVAGDSDGSGASGSGAAEVSLPASTTTSVSSGRYIVQPGDTLSAIAARAGATVTEIAVANGINPGAVLPAGRVLTLSRATVPSSAATAQVNTTTASSGRYVVQPGDSLSAIAGRSGATVTEVAAANSIDPGATLRAGTVLTLPQPSVTPAAPTQAPAVGTTIVGRMTWFGGPLDPSAQGVPASGLGWRTDGMSFDNYGSMGHRWLIRFPWGQTLNMTQIDVGPAPWTGNPFDLAFSALPNTPYDSHDWPNPIVTGIYQGG